MTHKLSISCRLRTAVTGLLAIPLLLAGCEQGPKVAPEAPPPGVLVAKVQPKAISETVEFIGQTVAVNDVTLRSLVEGYLLERNFEEGQDVRVGDELYLIDPEYYQATVAAAEGKVAQAKAELARATKDLTRYRKLIKKQSISQQNLDKAESDRLQAAADLKSAEAELLKANIDLSHTVIKAPIDGRIGRTAVSIGDLVSPQTEALARLVELDPIYANFSISERDVIKAKRRNNLSGNTEADLSDIEVTLRLPDGSKYEHIGRLDFIDNVVDRRTGTVVVRARFDNPKKLLTPGIYVSTALGRNETIDKLVIPQSAVQENQAGTFVMVVGPDNKVEQRQIETGRAEAGELVIKSGLDPDELVIVEGIQKVRPGIVVEPKIAPRVETMRDDPASAPTSDGSGAAETATGQER